MARTEIRSRQIKDGGVKREDMNTDISGRAVTTKVTASNGLVVNSTGVDVGTGDVDVQIDPPIPHNLGGTNATTRQDAIDSLTSASTANNNEVLTKNPVTGNAIFQEAQYSPGYVFECIPHWVDTNQISISPGFVRDDTNVLNMRNVTALTASLNTSGVNGLDTGTKSTNTWYYLFVVGDTNGVNNVASLFSSSLTPILPSGYNVKRRVGSLRTNASGDLIKFQISGNTNCREVFYDETETDMLVLSNGNSITFSTVNCGNFIPPISHIGTFHIHYRPGSSTNSAYFRPNGSIITDTLKKVAVTLGVGGSDNRIETTMEIETNNSQQIQYAVETGDLLDLSVMAYKDYI